MGISHISLATGRSCFAAMRTFYMQTLAPLGYVTYFDNQEFGMLGLKPRDGFPDFWIHVGNGEQPDLVLERGDVEKRPGRTHVAFDADSKELVDAWYEGAVKAGGIPNGAPGIRKIVSDTYYAAFVLDPLGNNIEVVNYPPTQKP